MYDTHFFIIKREKTKSKFFNNLPVSLTLKALIILISRETFEHKANCVYFGICQDKISSPEKTFALL